jgi:hypothetical protein
MSTGPGKANWEDDKRRFLTALADEMTRDAKLRQAVVEIAEREGASEKADAAGRRGTRT